MSHVGVPLADLSVSFRGKIDPILRDPVILYPHQ